MVDLQNLLPGIDIDIDIGSSIFFFLIFAGKISVVLYFLESFVFYHIFAHYFCFTFSAILDF